jgi:Transcriptional regulator
MERETERKRRDRRVLRSRQALIEAFRALLEEKAFSEISVYQISERADLNRGTFYAHFSDKYELLEQLIREQFRAYLDKGLSDSQYKQRNNNLQRIIQLVISYFQESRCIMRPDAPIAYIVERALQHELQTILANWLQQNSGMEKHQWSMPLEMVASMMAWSIFGATSQLCSNKTLVEPEALAAQLETVLMQGISSLWASAKL